MLNILINRKHLLTASDIIIVAFEFIGINFRITILGCVLQTGKDLQFLWCNGCKQARTCNLCGATAVNRQGLAIFVVQRL